MASIRVRLRGNGTTAYNVMYILDGRQTSVTFDSEHAAAEFRDSVNLLGAERAMAAFGIAPTAQAARITSGETVASWVAKYIATRTGVAKSTVFWSDAACRWKAAASSGRSRRSS